MRHSFKSAIVALAGLAVVATGAVAGTISGAGATFPYPIYSKWAGAYQGVSGDSLNYQSIGSGGGIAQIKAKTVTFGASDMPMKPKDLDAAGLIMFPTVVGGVVPVINVKGIGNDQLVLDGPTLAGIFQGKISKWNDGAIKALNPGANLPDQAIVVVHRSDGSGTTFIWTNYLSKASKDWADNVSAATSVDWPVGIGAKGNEGVAGNVAQTSGSIGYVEYAYAKQNHLKSVRMKNKDGAVVSPSLQSFAAAAANTNWAGLDHFYVILTDAPGKDSWPIAGATFILVYKQPVDPGATSSALKFFKWAYANGDDMARSLDYVPLPDNAVNAIQSSWKQVQGSGM
ncbi:MAG TPA: phosphate ABC transporter substrate-binding protein PstS [Rhizomicrobium sp.]|nr:phosphate ABC transporter substrate-binding protein PstS [Rhizomicrobium sp.]